LNENQTGYLELTLYIKLIYKLNTFGHQFRLGIGESYSYVECIP